MAYYYEIDRETEEGRQTAEGLLRLRDQLENGDSRIPPRNISETVLLATWNIREFDSQKYGHRLEEAYYYIAEIISHFDLVAIQEVREDLGALKTVKKFLGQWWDYLVTDVTAGKAGNRERLAFFYDKRKVHFAGLAGEIVLPSIEKAIGKNVPVKQLARTPYICGFKAGWSKFNLCTVHILYGTSNPEDPQRIEEIKELCKFLARRAEEQAEQEENLILLGDFNIFKPKHQTMQAIVNAGFIIPRELQKLPGTNVAKNKYYDQIAFKKFKGRLEFSGHAGVFDYYDSVFTLKDEVKYHEVARKSYQEKYNKLPKEWPGGSYRAWRTYQMSDHLPMWIELKVDFGEDYLKRRTKRGQSLGLV